MSKIGILAGIFDPIHDGHLAMARSSVEYLGLSKLFFLVEKSGWGGKKPASLKSRQEMVSLATKDDELLHQLVFREDKFDLTDTLPKIESLFANDELFFIFGADVFLSMNDVQWPKLERLFKHYIVVFERKDIDQEKITKHARRLGIVVGILPSEHLHHSSSDVRFAQEKHLWLPEKVAQYIDKNGLY